MITTRKLDDGFLDETVLSLLVRSYAHSEASGYVAALNLTPHSVNYSEVLNLDLVLTEYLPVLAGRFGFDYSDPNRRIARRSGRGVGRYEHVHLSADQPTINFLLQHLRSNKKIWMEGDEIAIQNGMKCWLWKDPLALELLQIDSANPLHEIMRTDLKNASPSERQCHSISVQVVSDGSEIRCGSGMGGHFAAASAGVVGYGGQIAKTSMEKVRKDQQDKAKNGQPKSRNTTSKGDNK